ncbi:uncharacterized protein LOC113003148 isoform X2 [Solenopsis invicta]|uniref:uncharacterized protein LOC113003148 isoform X2 n=1 Tax=Solenopsis invicta TaxID=13686 RepID=UPI00193DB5D5|nr:uncharacterized protein LOC113003148 isoform X2 [Solenopsis invicta]
MSTTKCRAFVLSVNREEEDRRVEDLGSRMFEKCGQDGVGRSGERAHKALATMRSSLQLRRTDFVFPQSTRHL